MSEARTKDIDAAVVLIEQAMEIVEYLNRSLWEGVTTNGITVVLQDVIRRIEALGDDEGE